MKCKRNFNNEALLIHTLQEEIDHLLYAEFFRKFFTSRICLIRRSSVIAINMDVNRK